MRSFRFATLRGIPVFAHPTLAVVGVLFLLQLGLWGLPAFVLLFASIVLHELGHAEVARHYGIRVPRIDLHLLGGTASLASTPKTPRQEILIAAAGPLVSMTLALGLGGIGAGLAALGIESVSELVLYGAGANLVLALFNLVPALPMDGGRIFRAALSAKLGSVRSTEIAATVSRVFGGLFIAGGLAWGSLSLALVGGALFFLSGQEERLARARGPYTTGPVPTYRPPRWAHHDLGTAEPLAPDQRRFVDPWGRVWVIQDGPTGTTSTPAGGTNSKRASGKPWFNFGS